MGFRQLIFAIIIILQSSSLPAQDILFDFDNAPLHASLPIDLSVGGVAAHFSATGQGYSIQYANTMGFTPPGFGGLCIYPSSVFASNLLVSFDHVITDFSIMYAAQELGCDDAETMRVYAYMGSTLVGYVDHVCGHPGTWPSDTLRCTYSQGFDNVVVHYQAPPPTCQDYGVIFMADNMRITASPVGINSESQTAHNFILNQNYPNPFNPSTSISYSLPKESFVTLKIYDIEGREVAVLVNEEMKAGEYKTEWNAASYPSGAYFIELTAGNYRETRRMVLLK